MDDLVKTRRIAVIPARGGSKRIPRKNIIDFQGRPMIAWTIEAALQSGLFDRVLVSTDDAETAEIASGCGASAPFLRRAHADDVSPVSQATLAALDQVEAELGESYGIVAQLLPNCPFRDGATIAGAVSAFEQAGAPFQISCFRYGWMNPWWALREGPGGGLEPLFPEALKTRSQDLPALFCPTGSIWLAEVGALRSAGTFYGPGHRYHEIGWVAAFDIDDEDDLTMANAMAVMRASRPR